MRPVLMIVGLILALAALATGVGAPQETAEVAGHQLVRTADGWEPYDTLFPPPPFEPRLHPLVVAAAQLFASLLTLLALSRPR